MDSPSPPPATSAFPSFAEQVAPAPLAHTGEQLIVLAERAEVAAEAAAIVPFGSLLVSTDAHSSGRDVQSREIDSIAMPSTFAALRELLSASEADVLLLSERELLTPGVLKALRVGLAADSACATVSINHASPSRGPGLPPPGAPAPHPGAALVRRDHLILALDEAELAGRADVRAIRLAADKNFVPRVLATLVRPGFIHRVVALHAEAPPSPTVGCVSAAARFAADVVLDGRCLSYPLSGTQVQFFGLAAGLARAGVRVAVLRPHELHPSVTSGVMRLAKDVPFVERSRIRRPAIFHRPFQMWSLKDVADCLSVGERLVLTHQDMILDRTPAYAATIEGWHDYRRTTYAALSSADAIGFFSHHAAADAASEGMFELDRATVVPLGVDHLSQAIIHDAVADPLQGLPYLLVLGNSYWHKNRLFGLRLARWLVEREDWDGGLVLAGGDTGLGSSVVAEQALLRATAELRDRVVDVGHVSEAERAALYRGAELVLFPSLYEGFGLIPFEAAAFGTACVYAYRASMREFLPEVGALPSFDLDEAGPFVANLLRDRPARERVRTEIMKAASRLTWERTAAGYLEVYARALDREPCSLSRLLVGIDPSVTEKEALLLDVYRRRLVFRFAVDGAFRAVRVLRARASRRRESP